MTARFLHVSDLHFGAGRDAEIEVGPSRLLENLDLELIVASGDLTSPGLAPGDSAAESKQGVRPSTVALAVPLCRLLHRNRAECVVISGGPRT